MGVTDVWSDWVTDPASDSPPSTATPEIDKELRNIKAQVKGNVVPGRWAADDAGLTTLISDIGSSQAEIVFDSALTINPTGSTYTIPANITVKSIKPGVFNVAALKTLSIAGPLIASPYTLFTWGTGGFIDVSTSPTNDLPVEWWGGVAGASGDISAALSKINDGATKIAVGPHQNVLLNGVYRIANPVTWLGIPKVSGGNNYPSGYGLIGSGLQPTFLIIDTAGEVGLTFGASGANGVDGWRVKDFSVIGAASCCTYAMIFYNMVHSLVDLNFFVGATDYALQLYACNKNRFNIQFGGSNNVIAALGLSAAAAAGGGIYIPGGGTNKSNTWNKVFIDSGNGVAMDGTCLYLNGTGDNWDVSGNIEMFDTGIKIDAEAYHIRFHDMHIEENDVALDMRNAHAVSFKNVNFADEVAGVNIGIVRNSHGVEFENCKFNQLYLYPGVTGSIRNGIGHGLGEESIIDMTGGGMEYYGFTEQYAASGQKLSTPGVNRLNLFNNVFLSRWNNVGPDPLSAVSANQTWSKATQGAAGAPAWRTDSLIKIVTSAFGVTNRDLAADEITKFVLGKTVTASIYAYLNGSQTFTDNGFYLSMAIVAPAWADTADYAVGDAVTTGVSTYMAVCVRAGTPDTEPTWAGCVPGDTFDEGVGAPLWVIVDGTRSSIYDRAMKTADIGAWHQLSVTQFIPNNPTNAYYQLFTNPQDGPVNATAYLAEPGLNVGCSPWAGIRQGKDEHVTYIQIGPNRIYMNQSVVPTDAGSPIYTWYALRGDVAWGLPTASAQAPGWVCITSGWNNAGGTAWKPMANLA